MRWERPKWVFLDNEGVGEKGVFFMHLHPFDEKSFLSLMKLIYNLKSLHHSSSSSNLQQQEPSFVLFLLSSTVLLIFLDKYTESTVI